MLDKNVGGRSASDEMVQPMSYSDFAGAVDFEQYIEHGDVGTSLGRAPIDKHPEGNNYTIVRTILECMKKSR